ncbi:hypothetical protein Y032_0029g1933 [Ancylostoma ceylanicum]|uniref:Uncharacterized protein n=1 Tax=Ancylostoma ceylanicum TaxID=53326 RepID=A0A016USS5_9BILA|nr:hypothetical protein Y032_0029g1933 [Ancylostoma ceylanicum]
MVIAQAWNDEKAATLRFAKKINEGNTSLTEKLNESFVAIGSRLDSLRVVAMLDQDTQSSKVAPFTGAADSGMQFSIWFLRLEDIIRMRPAPLNDEQKANFSIGHLDSVRFKKISFLLVG